MQSTQAILLAAIAAGLATALVGAVLWPAWLARRRRKQQMKLVKNYHA